MTIHECDRCGKNLKDSTSYKISVEDGAFEYEICENCLNSFVDWLINKKEVLEFPIAIGDTVYENNANPFWESTVEGLYSNGKENYALVSNKFPGSERWINLARLGIDIFTEKNDGEKQKQ